MIITADCQVKQFRISEKGIHAITIMERSGAEFVLRSKNVDLSQTPILVPVHIEADCNGFVAQGMNYIDVRSITFKKLDVLP